MAIITRDGETIIRIGGQDIDTIRPADFDAASDDRALETSLKSRIEGEAAAKLPPEKRPIVLIHIFDRAGKDYVIGIRPPGWTLPEEAVKRGLEWWQVPPYSDAREVVR